MIDPRLSNGVGRADAECSLSNPESAAAGYLPRPAARTDKRWRSDSRTPPQPTAEQPEATPTAAKQPRSKKSKKAAEDGKEKKLSALDAAAKVLAEADQPMSCQEMIAAMAAKGYWVSPGGKTPQATLYSALLREITAKGTSSRFVKTERGKFSRKEGV